MNSNPPKTPGKWTVMLYLAGDNNLSEECVYSLVEAKQSLTDNDKKLTVLAQFDPAGVHAQTKRYLLSGKGSLEKDAQATGWTAYETDTGEPDNLLEFVRWSMSQFPAEHFMLVLVGHGSGTDDDFLLHDDNPPNALSIAELRYVFEKLSNDGRTIDILGMDTCLMNMAEVCFELLRTNLTYLVGSEGFSPNTGWPYKRIIKKLTDKIRDDEKGATADWLAPQIVEEYKQFYVPYINGGISVDQSALRVKKIDEVKKKMFSLVGTLLDEFDRGVLDYGKDNQNALLLAHWETQSYNGEVFVDLFDFCECLAVRYNKFSSDVVKRCREVQAAIKDLVVTSRVAGAAFQFSNGLSIYFPWAVRSPAYGNLAFASETRWVDFLDRYHTKTRREGRTDPGDILNDLPVRASVPTNKGRNGNVESMRNPPTKEYISPDPAPEPKPVTVTEEQGQEAELVR